MKFQTKRCKYEDLRYTDIDEAVKLFTNEKVRKFLGGPISEEAARAKLNSVIGSKDICYCAVRLIETNELIGLIIFTTAHNEERTEELSYMFLPEYWGKGYAYETLYLFIDYAINILDLHMLFAETQSANIRSCKLLDKLEFIYDHTLIRFGAEQKVYKHLLEEKYVEIEPDEETDEELTLQW